MKTTAPAGCPKRSPPSDCRPPHRPCGRRGSWPAGYPGEPPAPRRKGPGSGCPAPCRARRPRTRCLVLVGDIHVLPARIGERQAMDGREHPQRHDQRIEPEIADEKPVDRPQRKRHCEHRGNRERGAEGGVLVQVQHHDGREGQHRAHRQVEIAADHHEGHAQRHDAEDRRGPDHAKDVVDVDEARVPEREAHHEQDEGDKDALPRQNATNGFHSRVGHSNSSPIGRADVAPPPHARRLLRGARQTSVMPPSIITICPVM
jgi:hypothetical protein